MYDRCLKFVGMPGSQSITSTLPRTMDNSLEELPASSVSNALLFGH